MNDKFTTPHIDIQEVCDNLKLSELKKFAQRVEQEFYIRLEAEQDELAERKGELDELTKDLSNGI